MGFTMQGWHSTFLGMRELPRDISDFEMKAFFTFETVKGMFAASTGVSKDVSKD